MRGKWNLTFEEKEYWAEQFKIYINILWNGKKDTIELSPLDIAPCHVKEVLEYLGFSVEGYDSSGWEQDTWYNFKHPRGIYPDIVMYYCGFTFELNIFLAE